MGDQVQLISNDQTRNTGISTRKIAKSATFGGRIFSLFKSLGAAVTATATLAMSTASLVAYVAIRVLSMIAFATIIGIPISLLLWPVSSAIWAATSMFAEASYDLFKKSLLEFISAVKP